MIDEGVHLVAYFMCMRLVETNYILNFWILYSIICPNFRKRIIIFGLLKWRQTSEHTHNRLR